MDTVPMPTTTLRAYRYLDAVLRHGSIRRAADHLGLASSALNRRVLEFEAEIGAPVFERLPRGLRLTQAGELVAGHIRATLNDWALLSDRLRALDGAVHGRVVVGSAESAALSIVPVSFAALHKSHPQLGLELSVGTPTALAADLLSGRVDLILTHEQPRGAEFDILAAATEPFCALMRPGHALAQCLQLDIGACLAYPAVIATDDLAARAKFDQLVGEAPSAHPPVLVSNLFAAMKQFVALTDAISFQFVLRSHRPGPADGLVAIPIETPGGMDTKLYLVARAKRTLPPAVAEVAARLGDALRG